MAKLFDWNDTITQDSKDTLPFVTLPDGVYEFEIINLEKTYYQGNTDGSGKTPNGCPEADVSLKILANGGVCIVYDKLFLYDGMEWKLSSFFRSLGLKEHGQSVKMDWNKVLGAKGKAAIYTDTWVGKDGVQRTNNKVKAYIDSDKVAPVIKKAVAPTADSDLPFEI